MITEVSLSSYVIDERLATRSRC